MDEQPFEAIEFTTAVITEGHCFECEGLISAGSRIVRAFWEPGAMSVVFHRDCWLDHEDLEDLE